MNATDLMIGLVPLVADNSLLPILLGIMGGLLVIMLVAFILMRRSKKGDYRDTSYEHLRRH